MRCRSDRACHAGTGRSFLKFPTEAQRSREIMIAQEKTPSSLDALGATTIVAST